MAVGLVALLDDIAAIAKMAAASIDDVAAAAGRASVKAAGVVVDDTAVTPQYVRGLDPSRELPIVFRIARGSMVNKLIIIALILCLNQWAPQLLTPLLMIGGTYLCFEGAEKVWERVHGKHEPDSPSTDRGTQAESAIVRGAVSTDFILSAEIMVISLNELTGLNFGLLLSALIITAIVITVGVYGTVGALVKMDDVGLRLMERHPATSGAHRFGEGLVQAMPRAMQVISVVGTLAMMWVGGHLFIAGMDTLGWPLVADAVHGLGHAVHSVPAVGGALAWIVETLSSMIFGFIWGSVVVVIAEQTARLWKKLRGRA